jgi:hypothetical protein
MVSMVVGNICHSIIKIVGIGTMSYIGLDLNGYGIYASSVDSVDSLPVSFSTIDGTPCSILLPMFKGENPVGGDYAWSAKRGSCDTWPPMSRLSLEGWKNKSCNGRILIKDCWTKLRHSISAIETIEWGVPYDDFVQQGLTPAEAISMHASSIMTERFSGLQPSSIVFAIPDWVEDFAQQQILDELRNQVNSSNISLIWAPIAAAIAWEEQYKQTANQLDEVIVLHASSIELSVFKYPLRKENHEGVFYNCPVRSNSSCLYTCNKNEDHLDLVVEFSEKYAAENFPREVKRMATVLSMTGASFAALTQNKNMFPNRIPDYRNELRPWTMISWEDIKDSAYHFLKKKVREFSNILTRHKSQRIIISGPLAKPIGTLLKASPYNFPVLVSDPQLIATGASIHAFRSSHGIPTYYDALPSLDLFTMKQHEPYWLPIIPKEVEIKGAGIYTERIPRVAKVIKDRDNQFLESYLRREGESHFRYVKTPLQEVQDCAIEVDFKVTAQSAGGFARVECIPVMTPEVFGRNESLTLDWSRMEAIEPTNGSEFPDIEFKYSFPKSGSLYASKDLFSRLCINIHDEGRFITERNWNLFPSVLCRLKEMADNRKSLVDANAEVKKTSPLESLLTLGSKSPAKYLDPSTGHIGDLVSENINLVKEFTHDLTTLIIAESEGSISDPRASRAIRDDGYKIISRLSIYVPDILEGRSIENLALRKLLLDSQANIYAAGRLLHTPKYIQEFIGIFVAQRLSYSNQNTGSTYWMRALVYIIFLNEDALSTTNRGYLAKIYRHAAEVIKEEVQKRNYQVKFINALRLLALCLRYRRHLAEDNSPFISERSDSSFERQTYISAKEILNHIAERVFPPSNSRRRARDPRGELAELILQWLDAEARTNVMVAVYDD